MLPQTVTAGQTTYRGRDYSGEPCERGKVGRVQQRQQSRVEDCHTDDDTWGLPLLLLLPPLPLFHGRREGLWLEEDHGALVVVHAVW